MQQTTLFCNLKCHSFAFRCKVSYKKFFWLFFGLWNRGWRTVEALWLMSENTTNLILVVCHFFTSNIRLWCHTNEVKSTKQLHVLLSRNIFVYSVFLFALFLLLIEKKLGGGEHGVTLFVWNSVEYGAR